MVKVKDPNDKPDKRPGRGRPTVVHARPSDGMRTRKCTLCLRTKTEEEFYNIETQSYCIGCMKTYQRLKKLMVSGKDIRAYIRGEIPYPVDPNRVHVSDPQEAPKQEASQSETTTTTGPAKSERIEPDYGPEDEVPEGDEVEVKPLDPDSDGVEDKWEGASRAGKQDYADDDDEELEW